MLSCVINNFEKFLDNCAVNSQTLKFSSQTLSAQLVQAYVKKSCAAKQKKKKTEATTTILQSKSVNLANMDIVLV